MALLTGTAGPDLLTGSSGADEIRGLGGNDVLAATGGANTLLGGDGDDQLTYGKSIWFGLGGPPSPDLSQVSNLLDGGAGRDVVVFQDFIYGFWQRHFGATYAHYGVLADLSAGTVIINNPWQAAAYGTDRMAGIEDLVGTLQDDVLLGDAGDNLLDGRAGNDTIRGGGGNDTLMGGEGFDWLSLEGAAGPTLVDLAVNTAWDGLGGTDSVVGFEAVWGSGQNDTILGSEAGEVLKGLGGRDHLAGRGGNDTLLGGAGDDILDGGAGYDQVVVEGIGYRGTVLAPDPEVGTLMTTAEGTDRLLAVEDVRFIDGRLILDPNAPEALVTRLYEFLLGRAPETGALDFWSDLLAQGMSLSAMASGFMASAEASARFAGLDNAAFVNVLYESGLGRGASAGEATFWRLALNAGASRGDLAVQFSESLEYRLNFAAEPGEGIWRIDAGAVQVARIFDTLLNRMPQEAELVALSPGQRIGRDGALALAEGALASEEYHSRAGFLTDEGFVQYLYNTALNHAPDAASLAYWSAALGNGMTRAELALTVSNSAEHVALTAPLIDDGILFA